MDVFDPDTIDEVDHVLENFNNRRQIELTTPDEIVRVIKSLPNKKAPSHDGIKNSELKNLLISYADHLANLINSIFKFLYFPKIWKHALLSVLKNPERAPLIPRFTALSVQQLLKAFHKPSFHTYKIFNLDLVSVHSKKTCHQTKQTYLYRVFNPRGK